jgi:hypothetical protein
MKNVIYGFVVEPHKNGLWLVSPATKEDDAVTCHDLSGFLGSWKMKESGEFIPSVSGESCCGLTLNLANKLAFERNKETL